MWNGQDVISSSPRAAGHPLLSWVWIGSYLICIRLLGYWSHSHVDPLYIHWKIKLQKFLYIAIYVLVGADCFFVSRQISQSLGLNEFLSIGSQGDSMHRTLENGEAQPNVKMFSSSHPSLPHSWDSLADSRPLIPAGTRPYCPAKRTVWGVLAGNHAFWMY